LKTEATESSVKHEVKYTKEFKLRKELRLYKHVVYPTFPEHKIKITLLSLNFYKFVLYISMD